MDKSKKNIDFIKISNIKHDNFYNYDKSIYVGSTTKLIITCPLHGDFEQTPSNHKRGQGCFKCGRKKANKKRSIWTEASFRKKVSELHPTLDFTRTVYVNPTTRVLYDCKVHGERKSHPYSLLKGCGCKRCNSSKNKISKEDWLKRFYECGYKNITYEKIPEYFKAEEKITFNCINHGEFKQTPIHHLKSNCPKCGRERIKKHNQENPTGWRYTNWQEAAKRSKNFDSFKVYIIRCWNKDEEFYKIGKTYTKLKIRFRKGVKSKMPYNYEIIKVFESKTDGVYISKLEKELQRVNKENKYTPKINFQGMNECFVSPRYSSQECSKCGHTCKENRPTQSLFECVKCGFTENADFQATLNLFKRGRSLMEVNVNQ